MKNENQAQALTLSELSAFAGDDIALAQGVSLGRLSITRSRREAGQTLLSKRTLSLTEMPGRPAAE